MVVKLSAIYYRWFAWEKNFRGQHASSLSTKKQRSNISRSLYSDGSVDVKFNRRFLSQYDKDREPKFKTPQ